MTLKRKLFNFIIALILMSSSHVLGATDSFIKLADLQLVDLSHKVQKQLIECSKEEDDTIYRDCVSLKALKLVLSRPDRNDGVVQPLFTEVFFKLEADDRVEALNTLARSVRRELEKGENDHVTKATAYQVVLNLIKQIQMQESTEKYRSVLNILSESSFDPETDFINFRKRHGGPFTYSLKELVQHSSF